MRALSTKPGSVYMREWYRNRPHKVKWCIRCKTKFKTKFDNSYCRRGCSQFTKMGKLCKHCGDIFLCKKDEYNRRLYCSRSCSASSKVGENAKNWQGGKTSYADRLRTSQSYKIWRNKVFNRDGYKCVDCGDDRGGNLEADHIKPRSLYPELTLDLDNGRTLCKDCHKRTDTWGKKLFTYKKTCGIKV